MEQSAPYLQDDLKEKVTHMQKKIATLQEEITQIFQQLNTNPSHAEHHLNASSALGQQSKINTQKEGVQGNNLLQRTKQCSQSLQNITSVQSPARPKNSGQQWPKTRSRVPKNKPNSKCPWDRLPSPYALEKLLSLSQLFLVL